MWQIESEAFKGCVNLKSVEVDIREPLTISNDTFEGVTNATLYVPVGCKTAYEAADCWKEFKEIKEMEIDGIASVLQQTEYFDVYDLKGNLLRSQSQTLRGLPKGIYVVNGKKIKHN